MTSVSLKSKLQSVISLSSLTFIDLLDRLTCILAAVACGPGLLSLLMGGDDQFAYVAIIPSPSKTDLLRSLHTMKSLLAYRQTCAIQYNGINAFLEG